MQKVHCLECGKSYDYDEDAFCPKCGAFNQPGRTERRLRETERVDGLGEAGHKGSFLHQEFHAEEQVRRRVGLDKSVDRSGGKRPTIQRESTQINRQNGRQAQRKSPVNIIVWIIFAIIAFNVLSNFLFLLL